MSYELFIARRYLQSKQKTRFLSIISFIAMGGVILGVAALVIMLSVTNGFTGEVKSRLVGMNAHVAITKYHHEGIEGHEALARQVTEVPGVIAVAPVVESKLVIATGAEMDGIFVWGVDAGSFPSVSDVTDHLRYDPDHHLQLGQLEGYKNSGIVLGAFLASRLRVGPGDEVYLISIADRDLESLLTGFKPRLEPFTVTDVFETGMYHHDDNFGFISLTQAQRIMGLGDAVTSLHLRVDNLDAAVAVRNQLQEELGYPYRFQDWTELFPELFQWMQLEKWVIFIALSLIIVVASFNIMSILSMSILIKTPEIGILRTMGARSAGIRRIFVYQGLFIGLFGTALGSLFGFVIGWLQARFDLITLPADIYIIGSLPVDMRISDFAIVSIVSLSICLLASVFPARKAAALQPVDAIRYVM